MESFGKQLDRVVREKKIPVRYPKGYQQWKQTFETSYRKTRDISQAIAQADAAQRAPAPQPTRPA